MSSYSGSVTEQIVDTSAGALVLAGTFHTDRAAVDLHQLLDNGEP